MRFLSVLPFIASAALALKPWKDWDHGRVALDDVSIHFRYAGSGPPVFLVHGNPQHSLTWQHIGPILAENYTVIAPDNRGFGDSSIPANGDYSAAASAADLSDLMDFLNITSAYFLGHDKGVGYGVALAIQDPEKVKRLAIAEYPLPGYGYEVAATPATFWDTYQNWQLAFFQVPDLAEFLMRDRERAFLQWYFFHGSYSGGASFTEDTVNQYVSSISKPGFLRAMLGAFSASTLWEDNQLFTAALNESKLDVPLLGMGGEASLGYPALLNASYSVISNNAELVIIPKSGHWTGDENPSWTANRVADFFAEDDSVLPDADLSALDNAVTLGVGLFGIKNNLKYAEGLQF